MSDEVEGGPNHRASFRGLFICPDGLRSGWSIVLFALAYIWLGAIQASKLPATSELPVQSLILDEALQLGFLGLVTFVISRIERRKFGAYGFGASGTPSLLRDFGAGLFWGISLLSLLIAGLRMGNFLSFDGFVQHGPPALGYAFAWAFAFLLVGLFEEFAFRGFLQFTVARGISGIVRKLRPQSQNAQATVFWCAAIMFSVILFATSHISNQGESTFGIASIGMTGLTLAFSLWRTGTLWWAIGFHTAWDWAQSYLYGVADSGLMMKGYLLATHPLGDPVYSGGTTGPEGSVFVIPTLLLACLIIHITLPKRTYPMNRNQESSG